MEKIKVGVIGCGTISGIYLKNLTNVFEVVEVVACTDINMDKAIARATEFGIKKVCSINELFADPEIKIVLNLTIPKVHAEVCIAAIKAGKNICVEKPIAVTREDGQKILKIARENKLLVGVAPDTFMGGGIQTCRKLIDDGWIGEPIAATAFMMNHGHEGWHPDPEFYYKAGGGPMFDMGPYYITALISLMGPVKRVTSSASITFPERIITSTPKYGERIKVEIPTHITGIMDFENGAVGTIITSFDVWGTQLPRIEIYGTEGTLSVPDPNTFGGPVLICRHGETVWREIPLTHGYIENSRGLGVVDMAYSLLYGCVNRANGELAYHVLDIMQGFYDSSNEEKHYKLESTCEKPKPLKMGINEETIFA